VAHKLTPAERKQSLADLAEEEADSDARGDV
jgi:hypothetical protein